jgi:hypothetical protein
LPFARFRSHELVAAVRMEGDRWGERIIWHPVHSHLLATAGNDQHAYVWDLKRIRQLKHVRTHPARLLATLPPPRFG